MAADSARPSPQTSRRRWAVLGVLCVSLLIVSLDSTIVNIVLPTLVKDLKASESALQWVVDAYSCAFAGFLLVAGSFGDRFGRKRLLFVGLGVFALGSAGAAVSGSVATLVAARGVMGLGAACIMPATLAIITDVFRDPDDQVRAIAVWSGTTGLGIAVGPIVGGWLLAHFWWGSVFLINVPIALVGLGLGWWLVPESYDPSRRRIDLVGAILSVLGLGSLLYAIIDVPVDGWLSAEVLGAGGAAVALLVLFWAWERRATHPMLVLDAFKERRFSVAMAAVAFAIFGLMGALFVLTQYLQFSLGYSPLATGVRILPIAAVLAVAAVASSKLDQWLGTKVVVAAGLLVVAGGLWQLTTTTVADGFGHVLIGMLLLGLGAGLIIAPATASVMASLPPSRTGVGSATNSTALQVGGSLGVAVIGAVLSAHYQHGVSQVLAGHAVPAAAASAVYGSLGGALEVARMAGGTLGAALAAAARQAFVVGMDRAVLVGAAVVAAGAAMVVLALPARRDHDKGGNGGLEEPHQPAGVGGERDQGP